jgi:hypothetical protein
MTCFSSLSTAGAPNTGPINLRRIDRRVMARIRTRILALQDPPTPAQNPLSRIWGAVMRRVETTPKTVYTALLGCTERGEKVRKAINN